MPLDEAEPVDLAQEDHKGSRTHRWKEKLSRTRSKLTKHNDKSEGEFKLPDDVNDFLAAGRPSTSSSVDRSLDALPAHPTPSKRREVPRIDIAHAQRFPQQRDLAQDASKGFLTPGKHERSTSPGGSGRKKFRARGLSVGFVDTPPVIIGEGGDDADAPTIEISKPRARSASTMPATTHPRNVSTSRSPVRCTPVHEASDPSDGPKPDWVPRRLARAPTGGAHLMSAERLDMANREFEMSLQSASSTSSSEVRMPSPIRRVALPSGPAAPMPTDMGPPSHPESGATRSQPGLKPAVARNDLCTQFAEARALREGHYRNHSNSSFIEANSPVQTYMPPLQDLRLQSTANDTGNLKDVFSPTRPDSGKEEKHPGGWI